MCVAVPGKVLSIEGTKAVVDFQGNEVSAEAGLVDIKVGDYVLVHAGCILQKLTEFDRTMLLDLLDEIDEMQSKGDY